MLLSDKDIKKYLKRGIIKVLPKPNFSIALGASSLDLRLGNTFRVFNHAKIAVIDPFKKNEKVTTQVKVGKNKSFILHPQEFILAVTKERIELPDNISARLEGRSSLGRLGIIIHSTAGSISAGFKGNLVLELANMGRIPVILYPNMRICALSFEFLSSKAQNPYHLHKGSKYIDQKGPQESKLAKEKINSYKPHEN